MVPSLAPSTSTGTGTMFQNTTPSPNSARSQTPMLETERKKPLNMTIGERLRHFTWAWYTLTMSCGGLAILIGSQPNKFKGLEQIGRVVFIIDLFFFTCVSSLMTLRFILHGGFLRSLRHHREGLFFPTFWLSLATIISGLYRYFADQDRKDITPFTTALEVLFWLYCAFTLILAIVQYYFIFSSHKYPLQTMMPAWILPIFPVMLSGTIASVIAPGQPSRSAVPIICAGVTFQGLGFSLSLMMYAHYIGRLMESGLPNREHRPGMFISVGPPAFTALALIGMADALPDTFTFTFDVGVGIGETDTTHTYIDDARIMALVAVAAAVFLWALSLWFFCVAALAVVSSPPKTFHLSWWAMVFPNTGFTLATISLGNALDSDGVRGVASGMSICIVCLFLFVLVSHVRAVVRQDIMYPGKDEDVD